MALRAPGDRAMHGEHPPRQGSREVWDRLSPERGKMSFYLQPECALPEGQTEPLVEKTDPAQREWHWKGTESMHPFWSVTRITAQELGARNASAEGAARVRFNVELERKELNLVVCGRVTAVAVQMLTNTVELLAGEELVLETAKKPKREAAPADWRTFQAKRSKKTQGPQAAQRTQKAEFDSKGRQEL